MKRILYIVLLAVLLPMVSMAKDARQRTPQTIVADVLAEAPYGQQADYNQAMADLLGTGKTGVVSLAGMLVPAAEGNNNLVEYALDGLVAYASGHATPDQLGAVKAGLAEALDGCNDVPNKAFLMTLLSSISTSDDAPVFLKYLDNAELAHWAVAGLIKTPGTDDVVMSLINEGSQPHKVLARIAGEKKMSQAEPILLSWLKKADVQESQAIYRALAAMGTAKSLPVLAKAAAKENYKWVPSDATACYVELLNRLSEDKACSKVVAKDAEKLLKKTDSRHVRAGALTALLTAKGVEAAPVLYKAMNDADRQYRVAALRAAEPWADATVLDALADKVLDTKTPADVKTDIVSWFGATNASAELPAVIACVDADDEILASTAMKSAARIGGNDALWALIGQLGGKYSKQATDALLSFNGNIADAIVIALEPSYTVEARRAALDIAAKRRVAAAAPCAFVLLDDANLADAAYAALPGVVTAADIETICALLERADASRISQVQLALGSALGKVDKAGQYAAIAPYYAKSANKPLYYPALAMTGSPEAIDVLTQAYGDDETRAAALAALLSVDSPAVMDTLYEIAANNADANADALTRYTALVAKYGTSPVNRYQLYKRAIEIAATPAVQNLLLGRLAETGTYQALEIADSYIAREANADAAAAAIRAIMSKHVDEYYTPQARAALEKAAAQFGRHPEDADAGYAIDDIKGLLAKLDARAATAASATSFLTPQEEAEGFDMLFDGTSLRKWTGDTTTYIVRDGCITVNAAHWGNNIYTVDEYGDFVLRFEFALDRPGVNNGVGIRTPMNVDAAFHGMEIQILDHDDPMYKDLQPYQVHGSVYGVIPAKRVKFKHGEWNTEEIRAEGDNIKVTVNGKVILDGNIREACQGHAVGDPGEEGNHYMIDHRNHPGLFNKSGHIGFLGHGDGIRIRNVRVKEL